MGQKFVKSNQRFQVAGLCQCSQTRTQHGRAHLQGWPELQHMKFNNGEGCLPFGRNSELCSRKKELAKNMLSTHSSMYHLTNIYLMSTMKKGLPSRLRQHEEKQKTWKKRCLPSSSVGGSDQSCSSLIAHAPQHSSLTRQRCFSL